MQCKSSADLISAIANPDVANALVSTDLAIHETDWAAFPTPITIRRNMSISGVETDTMLWPVIDLGFVDAKVRVGGGYDRRSLSIASADQKTTA